MLKKLCAALLSVCMLAPAAANAGSSADDLCKRYSGTNVEAQNYQYWGFSKNTYLTDCGSGVLMCFMADALENHYIAEYYSSDYTLQRTQKIKKELPLFGAFYASSDCYFIISGQENREESPDVEVFRITKYDKDWNRIGSTGLKDCNTTNPFDAGTTDIAESGGYLIIRTSHEMYTDKNGINHEANVTIQVDKSKMKITDHHTVLSNNKNGYVSHSFNQFVKIDNGKISAVDHGDAIPRSICLMEYPTKVSSGKFSSGEVKTTDILKFGGEKGDNYTGASVGGFEITDSNYLVAYNQIDYSDYDWSLSRRNRKITFTSDTGEKTEYFIKEGPESRNVYIAVKGKASSKVSLKKISSCAEFKTASTPQLVRIGSNRSLVLWSEYSVEDFSSVSDDPKFKNYYYNVPDNKVFYAEIDASGKRTSDIYSFKGNLSDCQPVLYNNNIVWNTRADDRNKFYNISISDISQRQIVTKDYTHTSEYGGTILRFPTRDQEGIMEYTCDVCKKTFTRAIPKSTGILGDADRDGSVNIKDAALIQRFVVRLKADIDPAAADLDGDGRITAKDCTKLQKYIFSN